MEAILLIRDDLRFVFWERPIRGHSKHKPLTVRLTTRLHIMRLSSSPHAPPGGAINHWARCVVLVTASIALAYLIAAVTFIVRWMHFWVRGPHFQPYLSILVTMQAVFLLWWACRHQAGPLRLRSTVAYAIASGYVAGLIATVLYPLFQIDGIQQIFTALQFPALEAAIALFWFPVRLLTWLFGGIAGAVLVVLSRR